MKFEFGPEYNSNASSAIIPVEKHGIHLRDQGVNHFDIVFILILL